MPTYTYTGDEGRYYPTLGVTPEPGDRFELDRNPGDGRFEPPDPDPAPAKAAPKAAARAAAKPKEA